MGIFTDHFSVSDQILNVIEWEEYRDDILFWKWPNNEIKKGSRLIIRPGQNAIFMFDGDIEGMFTDEGSYDIESQIIPFLSTLKGFKFGFNSGMRAEVVFVNTKEFTMRWGTKAPVRLQAEGLPGGLPVRANGTFSFKIDDYRRFLSCIAGIKSQYPIDLVRERVVSMLDALLMKWISQSGSDIFNLMASATEIQDGIKVDLDNDFAKIGFAVTDFRISEFSYPENITKRADQAAEYSMIGDMGRFQQVAMVDAMTQGGGASSGGGQAADMAKTMAGMQMGMQMGNMMVQSMNNQGNLASQGTQPSQGTNQPAADVEIPNFCPTCGRPTNGENFCGNCGRRFR